ncbi:hypothetical protein [Planomonospora algeriensis]
MVQPVQEAVGLPDQRRLPAGGAVAAAPGAGRLRKGELETVESLLGYVGCRDLCKGGDWLGFTDRSSRVLADYCHLTSTLRVGTASPDALGSFRERSGLRLKPVRKS